MSLPPFAVVPDGSIVLKVNRSYMCVLKRWLQEIRDGINELILSSMIDDYDSLYRVQTTAIELIDPFQERKELVYYGIGYNETQSRLVTLAHFLSVKKKAGFRLAIAAVDWVLIYIQCSTSKDEEKNLIVDLDMFTR